MHASRRRFLQLLATVPTLVSSRAQARSWPLAPEIHSETRNTRFGALGRRWPPKLPDTPPVRLAGRPVKQLPPARHSGRSLGEVVASYARGQRFGAGPCELASLASLLHFSYGVTGRHGRYRLRAAPSAGALYAGEVYVVAGRVEGLAAGLYYYDVIRDGLVVLRQGSLLADVQAALERPAEIENAAFAVVLTNVFGRYSWRYANRAYRYALIDSGHTGENLRLAAGSAGMSDVSPLRFCDDSLNDLLGIDGRSEAVCALHAIGTPAGAHPQPVPVVRELAESQQVGAPPKSGRVTERYHEATKLVDADAPVRARSRPRGARPSTTPPTRLPEASSPATTVEAAIEIRRSATAFTKRPVTLPDASFLLEMADGSDALRRAQGVRLFAVVNRVAGLAPGIYEYLPSEHGLALVRGGAVVRSMLKAVGQPLAGTAAIAFVMAARLSDGASPLGDRWYRDLLLESGAIAQRIYLAAESAGLAARNLAAFVDDQLNEKLGLTALGLAALHLTVVGNGN